MAGSCRAMQSGVEEGFQTYRCQSQGPAKLWDFCATYHSEIRNPTALPLLDLRSRTPFELVAGQTQIYQNILNTVGMACLVL